MSNSVNQLPIIVFLLLLSGSLLASVPEDPNLCVVRVRNDLAGAETDAAAPNRAYLLPKFSLPYLSFPNSDREWTIDASGSLVPFPGPDPRFNIVAGAFTSEPGSGRLVVTNHLGVFVAQPPNGKFRQLSNKVKPYLGHVTYVPALDGVLIGSARLYLLRDEELIDIAGSELPGSIGGLLDAPAYGGVIVIGHRSSAAGVRTAAPYLYTYDNKSYNLQRCSWNVGKRAQVS